jgi:hypothetical protein
MACHADVDHAARAERDDEEGVERAEEEIRHREEVAGPDVRGVIAQEGRPRLPARPRGTGDGQIGLDGALGDVEPQRPQLAADPLGTPARVLAGHATNRGDGLRRERRTPRPGARLPSPERAEPRAAPAQQRVGLHDEEGVPPGADPPGQQDQERAVRRRDGRTPDAASQHDHLLAQHGVLGEQLRPTPQEIRAGPGGVRCRWSHPAAAAERASHACSDPGQPLAAPRQKHHQNYNLPHSAHQAVRGAAAPDGDSSRATDLTASEMGGKGQRRMN